MRKMVPRVALCCVVMLSLFAIFLYLREGDSTPGAVGAITKNDESISGSGESARGGIFDRQGRVIPVDEQHDGSSLENRIFSPVMGEVEMNGGASQSLTIDMELQVELYEALEKIAQKYKYEGGAGILMDVRTGEILSLVSYDADSRGTPAINRATQGMYMPGSVIKPFVAIGVLEEGVIDPSEKILSTGVLRLPDPSHAGKFFEYRDWKVHGYVDMREAIGVSSNVYFYTVGGGYGDTKGLGIGGIEKYLRMFGFGQSTGSGLPHEASGYLPSPTTKADRYDGAVWYLGDTYLASIGQHEYGVTPLQLARATGAIANGGILVTPKVMRDIEVQSPQSVLPIQNEHIRIVKDGMEYAVSNGTAAGLYSETLPIAAKTGTAEVGGERQYINSWITGYFPSTEPKYVFTIMLERGPWGEEIGAAAVAADVLSWVRGHRGTFGLAR